jgi:hypothetical protein
MSKQDNSKPKVVVTVNGKTLDSDTPWNLIYSLEEALKEASFIKQGSCIEILSEEARAVVSKCGY